MHVRVNGLRYWRWGVSRQARQPGVDSAWEQEKPEDSLPKVAIAQGKMLACTIAVGTGENAADRASELQANIAQPKRVSAGHPQRPVHHPGDRPGRFVRRFFVAPDLLAEKR